MDHSPPQSEPAISRYRNHPLIRRTFYFLLPPKLLRAIKKVIRSERLDTTTWGLDVELSNDAQKQPSVVGYRDGEPIVYNLLEPIGSLVDFVDEATAQWMNWDRAKVIDSLRDGDEKLERIAHAQRAYCGWLVSNPMYLSEQTQFCERWSDEIQEYGIPTFAPRMHNVGMIKSAARPNTLMVTFLDQAVEFLRRWHLAQLPAPGLPLPLGWQTGFFGIPDHVTDLYATIRKPHILPMFPDDTLQQTFEDGGRESAVEPHLAEWMGFVAKSNTGKQVLDPYARRFKLRHYWRALHERHAAACHRRREALAAAFAEFLEVDFDTLRQDLQFLDKKSGDGWYIRTS